MPAILWNYTMGGKSWGPVVAYGKVFLGSTDKKVYAFNQTTGEKIWEFTAGREIWASPAVAYDKVFIGSLDGRVYALDQSTGAKIWEHNIGAEIGSSLTVIDGRVYVGAINGRVYALDESTGAKIWEFTTGGTIIFSSPTVTGATLLICSRDGYLYALSKYDGIERWRVRVSSIVEFFPSSPAVSGDRVFIGSPTYNKTYALDIYTGSVVWEYVAGGGIWASPSIAYNKVFIGSADGKVYALDQSTGAKIWEYNIGREVVSPSAVADGMVIVPSNDGKLYALNQSSGSKVWDITMGGAGTCPAIADGKIYVVFGNTLYAIISSSTLTISISQTRANVGSTVTIEGNLSPARSGASIIIQWRREGETAWRTLATATTDAAGHYAYSWRPESEGSFELRAYWEGDASTMASQSDTLVVDVEAPPPLITMELLIAIIAAVGVTAALMAYIKRRPKKPKPSGLRISANPKEIFADGESASNITVELIDAQGNQIPAEKDVSVSLNATDGKIVGSITIPKGRSSATAILTSSTKIGAVSITASAKGLMDARTEVIFKEKKRYCMICGRRMPLEAKICPSCGNVPPSGVDTKVCKNCGTIIPEVARFCRECGAGQI
ncbi:MAG: PQQ-binding-like beta-propeller repeat protein [Candidatus Bathyarchaeia archaeon]